MTTERELQVPILDAVEEWHLGWLPVNEIRHGHTYLGNGGGIGIIAVASTEDGAPKFTGCLHSTHTILITTQTPRPTHVKGSTFWPTKELMPAPALEGTYLARWLLNQEQSVIRRQLGRLESLSPELKELPAYSEYLQFFSEALQNTLRKISLTYPPEERIND